METNWRTVKFGDICKINNETYSISENWDFVNYLDTGNITKNVINEFQFISIKNDKLPSRARRKVKNGNIIYSTVRPNQEHYGYITSQPQNFLVSTGFAVIDVNLNLADSKFIYYNLTQREYTNLLQSIAEQSTTTYPSIKSIDIANLKISIPSLSVQKKIAAILSALDDKIKLNEKINQNLEAQAQAILYKCKSNLSKSEIGDYLYFINGFAFKSSSYVSNGTFKIVTIKNVKDGKIDSIGSDSINEIPYGMPPDCFLDIGDSLMSLTGNVGRIGIVCEKKLLLNQRVAKIVPRETAWKGLAYFIMRFPETKSALKSIAHGTAQANLSTNDSLKVKLSFPVDITSNFAKILNSYYIKIQKNNMGSILLAQLRDALLPKLMSGEIDVSELAV